LTYAEMYKKVFPQMPHLRKPRWSKCLSCGGRALDHTEGLPPERERLAWKGCVAFGHGSHCCKTNGLMCLTQPMATKKGRCWCHKHLRKRKP
jgi:hypothetical protein